MGKLKEASRQYQDALKKAQETDQQSSGSRTSFRTCARDGRRRGLRWALRIRHPLSVTYAAAVARRLSILASWPRC